MILFITVVYVSFFQDKSVFWVRRRESKALQKSNRTPVGELRTGCRPALMFAKHTRAVTIDACYDRDTAYFCQPLYLLSSIVFSPAITASQLMIFPTEYIAFFRIDVQ